MIRIVLSLVLLLGINSFIFVHKYMTSGVETALEYMLSQFILMSGVCFLIIWPLNLSKKSHSSSLSIIFYIVLIWIIHLSVREVFVPKTDTNNLKHGLVIQTSIGTFSFGAVQKEDKYYIINNAAFFLDKFIIYAPFAEVSQNMLSMQQGSCFIWSNNTASDPKTLTNTLTIPLPFDMDRFYRSWNLDSSGYTPILYLLADKDILFNPYMKPFRKKWLLALLGYAVDLIFLMLVGAFSVAYTNKLDWHGIKFVGCMAFYAVLIPSVVVLYDYLILLSNIMVNVWL
ncbi:hypothetical protein SAMN02745150_00024 [Brevinema andersonii]|uniref:Uncharacterized protein n=1 Tax=Brevinema andersonii TaxID=34097 RepID=A0A1I1CYJ6_BREAD|nr:hypothetical protein [Brevinema andersonii]SFB67116.1 hypothetical protein SAMN02745150_00024 [Brevinema andersonii]